MPTDKSLDHGSLAKKAAQLPVPEAPTLKDPASYKIIGKNVRRLDGRIKAEGQAIFGMDIRLPGMVRAFVVHAPILGGKVVEKETLKKPGQIPAQWFKALISSPIKPMPLPSP
ncbi:MAG: hypothetical protein GY846_22400 [Deltaproteobacteria bacterium]|nr:hypothetical protein [Deltaproteobacteria bacterium]